MQVLCVALPSLHDGLCCCLTLRIFLLRRTTALLSNGHNDTIVVNRSESEVDLVTPSASQVARGTTHETALQRGPLASVRGTARAGDGDSGVGSGDYLPLGWRCAVDPRGRCDGDVNGRVSSELAGVFRVSWRRPAPCRACGRSGGLVRNVGSRIFELLSRELFVSVSLRFLYFFSHSPSQFHNIHR